MVNPEFESLSKIEWQFFCSFTFKSVNLSERQRLAMFFALLRSQADNFGIHFTRLVWVLRREHGDIGGRLHYHALIAGLPSSGVTVRTCFAFRRIWERLGGGHNRVYVYEASLDGVEYTLKRASEIRECSGLRAAGHHYETRKFGNRCDVMLSESLVRALDGRRFIARTRTSTGFVPVASCLDEWRTLEDVASHTAQSEAGEKSV